MLKLAVVVLSDPAGGSAEALGRVFNALALAHDARAAGDDVQVVFAGAGTRWPAELTKLTNPARELYDSVRDLVAGASCGCAAVFGATSSVEACGVPLLRDNPLPGTPGLAGLRAMLAEGRTPIVF
jgi:hypothetical protein